MKRGMLFVAASLIATLSFSLARAAETAPVQGKAEARVDKSLAKQEIQRFWITPEMLIMWSKDGPVNDLYVTRTTDGSDPILPNPATQRLFDNNDQDYGLQLGGRLTFGLWLDDASKWGFELSGFALAEGSSEWGDRSNAGSAEIVGVPVFLTGGTVPPGEYFHYLGVPGEGGTIEIESSSQLWGVQTMGVHNIKREKNLTLDALFGPRYLDLSEDFSVSQVSSFAALGGYTIDDDFDAHNQIIAANLGLRLNYTAWERLLLTVEPSVALGANMESLDIWGETRMGFVGPNPIPGGLFACPPTSGNHDRIRFAVVPEIKVGLGCKITKKLSFNASYNFLYISDVVRPGEQLNRRINETHVPVGIPAPFTPGSPPQDPALRFKTTDYWAHGVGVNFKIQF